MSHYDHSHHVRLLPLPITFVAAAITTVAASPTPPLAAPRHALLLLLLAHSRQCRYHLPPLIPDAKAAPLNSQTTPEVIDNPALFRKMDPECLFFAFYFQPNTYQQVRGAAAALVWPKWREATGRGERRAGGGRGWRRVGCFSRWGGAASWRAQCAMEYDATLYWHMPALYRSPEYTCYPATWPHSCVIPGNHGAAPAHPFPPESCPLSPPTTTTPVCAVPGGA